MQIIINSLLYPLFSFIAVNNLSISLERVEEKTKHTGKCYHPLS